MRVESPPPHADKQTDGQTRRDKTASFCNFFSNAPVNHKFSIKRCVSYFSLKIIKTAPVSDAILSPSTVHGRCNLSTSLYLSFIFSVGGVSEDARHLEDTSLGSGNRTFVGTCLTAFTSCLYRTQVLQPNGIPVQLPNFVSSAFSEEKSMLTVENLTHPVILTGVELLVLSRWLIDDSRDAIRVVW